MYCPFPLARILVIDDNPDNSKLVKQFLEWAGYQNVQTTIDPEVGIQMVEENPPDLLLLDLHMPKVDGYQVLTRVRSHPRPGEDLPILVFTADTSPEARQKALNLGASDFLTKPGDAIEIILRVRNFLRTRQMHLALQDANRSLSGRVQEQTEELIEARGEALQSLARAAEYRDDATGEHAKRVGDISAEIAMQMGLNEMKVEMIRLAAPLHDLGKIGIPDAILLRPGRLNDAEMAVIRRHPLIGAAILEEARSPIMKMAREIALSHHEWWDGTGYPEGLKGEAIPLAARIVAVADVFDALTHDRLYKEAWTEERAREEIIQHSGTHFDPIVVDAMNQVLDRGLTLA
jgi:putative two-component system response regulator